MRAPTFVPWTLVAGGQSFFIVGPEYPTAWHAVEEAAPPSRTNCRGWHPARRSVYYSTARRPLRDFISLSPPSQPPTTTLSLSCSAGAQCQIVSNQRHLLRRPPHAARPPLQRLAANLQSLSSIETLSFASSEARPVSFICHSLSSPV